MDPQRADTDLIEELQKGGEKGVLELVRTYQVPLLNFFYRLTWDRESAEDYTQEVFLRIFRSFAKISPNTNLSVYIFKTARNIWIDALRSKKRKIAETPSSQYEGRERGDSPDFLSQVTQKGPSPPEILIGKETVKKLMRAISHLSFEKKMVFVMGEYLEMKYEKIAEILEIPVGTVKSRMHSAVREIRDFLKASFEK